MVKIKFRVGLIHQKLLLIDIDIKLCNLKM